MGTYRKKEVSAKANSQRVSRKVGLGYNLEG